MLKLSVIFTIYVPGNKLVKVKLVTLEAEAESTVPLISNNATSHKVNNVSGAAVIDPSSPKQDASTEERTTSKQVEISIIIESVRLDP